MGTAAVRAVKHAVASVKVVVNECILIESRDGVIVLLEVVCR